MSEDQILPGQTYYQYVPNGPDKDERSRMQALSLAFDMRFSTNDHKSMSPKAMVEAAEVFRKFLAGK